MAWLNSLGREPAGRAEPESPEAGGASPLRRRAPALEALFESLAPGGGHAILDLGSGTQGHLRLYGRFARWIRFAGLLPTPPRGPELRTALRELPPNPSRPYDAVVTWNLLDLLGSDHRRALVEKLARITGKGARLYAVVDASDRVVRQPLRFTPLGTDRVVQVAVGRPEAGGQSLLPAEMERVLAPFRIERAVTLRIGMREYLAVKAPAPD